MTFEDLGFNKELENFFLYQNLDSLEVGRIIAEFKERYLVKTDKNEYEAEITGNLRFSARDRTDFPAVGDWVLFELFDNTLAIIHKILPRKTTLARQAVGKYAEKQIIATNIDFACIVQAADRDFNINRLERYLTLCNSAGIEPIVIISKVDLVKEDELDKMLNDLKSRNIYHKVLTINNISADGYSGFTSIIEKGKTYCFIGSSGVGKSTLINNLLGKEYLKTNEISESTNKGKHVTSHRELIVLENGGIVIDTPGMREVGIADTNDGVETTFENIVELATECSFSDCKHISEKGCAVIAAVEDGLISKASYENYLKLEREKLRFQLSIAEKHEKDKKFGKMIKQVLKNKKQTKF